MLLLSRQRVASIERRPSGHILPSCLRRRCSAHATETGGKQKAAVVGNGLTGKDVIVRYYEAYNSGDLDTIASLLAPEVSYHDMTYEEPLIGRDKVVKFLKKVRRLMPGDLKFVIEDVTTGDPRAVGITWHAESGEGVVLPFSRGCSFYTLNPQGQITTARDVVESVIKPGDTTLKVLNAVTPVIRRLGPAADLSALSRLPLASAAVWAFYAGYSAYIMLGSSAPGVPVYATPPEVLTEVFYESLNFFYVNIGLSALGLSPVPSVPCPPVSEAVFNFVNAWSLMALPYMLADGRSRKLGGAKRVVAWWTGIMFLTNVFYIPYLAQRAAPEPPATPGALPPTPPANSPLPGWAPAFGATSLTVGLLSIGWALAARPEYGGLAERLSYFLETFNSNRAFYAFIVDSGLYCIWQAVLMEDAPARYRFVPFFGMAAHLITGGRAKTEDEEGL